MWEEQIYTNFISFDQNILQKQIKIKTLESRIAVSLWTSSVKCYKGIFDNTLKDNHLG